MNNSSLLILALALLGFHAAVSDGLNCYVCNEQTCPNDLDDAPHPSGVSDRWVTRKCPTGIEYCVTVYDKDDTVAAKGRDCAAPGAPVAFDPNNPCTHNGPVAPGGKAGKYCYCDEDNCNYQKFNCASPTGGEPDHCIESAHGGGGSSAAAKGAQAGSNRELLWVVATAIISLCLCHLARGN